MEIVSLEEKKYIEKYKKLASKLSRGQTLSDYLVADFVQSAYKTDKYDSLVDYLKSLNKYIMVLEPAVLARQEHYEKFIEGKKYEDIGHRNWRLGMNKILLDAKEKYNKWVAIKENKFTILVNETPISINIDITVENVDEEIPISNQIEPPKPSKK